MKLANTICCLVVILLSFRQSIYAQLPAPTQTANGITKPTIYYYPFYNGKQVIEVELYGFVYGLSESELGSTFQETVGPIEIMNPIIVRNRQGQILQTHGFQTLAKTQNLFTFQDLASVNDAQTVTHKSRMKERNPLSTSYYYSGGRFLHGMSCYEGQDLYNIYDSSVMKGLMDTLGEIKIPPLYNRLYYDGYHFKIQKDRLYGMVGKDFTAQIPPTYTSLLAYSGNRYIACNEGCGVLDNYGREVLPPIYDSIDCIKPNGKIFVRYQQQGKWGLLHPSTLKPLTKPEYRYIERLSMNAVRRSDKALIAANDSMLLALLSPEGVQLTPLVYDQINFYTHELIRVKKKGKYGFMNYQGKEVVKPQYDWMSYDAYPLIVTRIEGKFGALGFDESHKIPFKYASFQFKNNQFRMRNADGTTHVYSKEGEFIREEPYDPHR